MRTLTTVTQKGQITLPKAMREKLSIDAYDRVQVELADDHVKIKPVLNILDLAGMFTPKKNSMKSILKARDEMERRYTRI